MSVGVDAREPARPDASPSRAASFGQHIEMAVWVVTFDLLSWTRTTKRLLETATRWSDRLGSGSTTKLRDSTDTADLEADVRRIQRAGQLVDRVSAWVPGTRCLHRALASRVWLARRGIDSEVVIGFRKDGSLEGHAWLEADGPSGTVRAFYDDSAGWREVMRG